MTSTLHRFRVHYSPTLHLYNLPLSSRFAGAVSDHSHLLLVSRPLPLFRTLCYLIFSRCYYYFMMRSYGPWRRCWGIVMSAAICYSSFRNASIFRRPLTEPHTACHHTHSAWPHS
ncbi:hypothetical protein JAAARDRAFT_318895 [Jaapia argillacea MUCL 33604]|uniref:Uncharacterized protein n=1 Tax=Jaapia argillacea MUCL 33604 TaxID=933084 RepID=A0A067Q0B2_9AGAM|nr:hypothetical protein JAAARDRAFT_318895 [Jaapia argillacea MUCL 33604]